ncbi:MAG: hypothetical protein CSA83_00490 [Actinomycetales bacterium]|nr:MAG: hypothetical protein CSA83_00490 [Actinomycetales bacterium]
MALKITKSLVDDIDESPATGTVTFALNGVNYSIDLNEVHQAELEAAFQPYIAHATRVSGRRAVKKSSESSSKTAEIREWAASEGLKIADRGRIPAEIIQAYEKAHS